MTRDLRWLVAGTAAITLLLVGAIGVVIRVAVLRRLQRFETAARQIAGGDLAQRVPAGGSDTISWLAREFNTMADSVTGLVGEVRNQRERLETVINSIDDGIVVLDAQRHVIAANDAFLLRARAFARAGAGLPVPRADARRLHGGRLSDPGLSDIRRAAGAHLRAAHAGGEGGVGRGARLAHPAIPPGACNRWWKCGATFPSGARRKPTWPNRTGWRRWARWRRDSRTS